MKHNNRFTMQDLFMNPKLANVFPQFDSEKAFRNVYSFAQMNRFVMEYLNGVLKGAVVSQNEMVVNGKHKQVLRQIRSHKATIEAFFNNIPAIVKNIRRDTKLYLPIANLSQLENLSVDDRLNAMRNVLDNINYNPNFNSQNRVASNSVFSYQKRQERWKRKVGYKE